MEMLVSRWIIKQKKSGLNRGQDVLRPVSLITARTVKRISETRPTTASMMSLVTVMPAVKSVAEAAAVLTAPWSTVEMLSNWGTTSAIKVVFSSAVRVVVVETALLTVTSVLGVRMLIQQRGWFEERKDVLMAPV